jgi:hypothetical protein
MESPKINLYFARNRFEDCFGQIAPRQTDKAIAQRLPKSVSAKLASRSPCLIDKSHFIHPVTNFA